MLVAVCTIGLFRISSAAADVAPSFSCDQVSAFTSFCELLLLLRQSKIFCSWMKHVTEVELRRGMCNDGMLNLS